MRTYLQDNQERQYIEWLAVGIGVICEYAYINTMFPWYARLISQSSWSDDWAPLIVIACMLVATMPAIIRAVQILFNTIFRRNIMSGRYLYPKYYEPAAAANLSLSYVDFDHGSAWLYLKLTSKELEYLQSHRSLQDDCSLRLFKVFSATFNVANLQKVALSARHIESMLKERASAFYVVYDLGNLESDCSNRKRLIIARRSQIESILHNASSEKVRLHTDDPSQEVYACREDLLKMCKDLSDHEYAVVAEV